MNGELLAGVNARRSVLDQSRVQHGGARAPQRPTAAKNNANDIEGREKPASFLAPFFLDDRVVGSFPMDPWPAAEGSPTQREPAGGVAHASQRRMGLVRADQAALS